MKPDLRLIRSVILLAFFCALSVASFGQVQDLIPADSTFEENEVSIDENDEKAEKLFVTTEKDSAARPSLTKAKFNTEPSKSERTKEETEEEDSILSFNFIYYIIRKFKLSDILDR